MRLPITSRKMHRSLTNSPPSPRRQSPSTGSGTVSEADEKGSPESHRTCERPPLFSFCPASDLTYPRSVRADGPFEPNCFASPTYEGAPKCPYFLALCSAPSSATMDEQRDGNDYGKRAERVPNRSSPPRRGGGGDTVLRGTVIRPMAFTPVE